MKKGTYLLAAVVMAIAMLAFHLRQVQPEPPAGDPSRSPANRNDPGLSQLPADVEPTLNVEFGTGGGRPLKMHLLRPKVRTADPLPVVVFIGGLHYGNVLSLARLAQRGYGCATIDFRMGEPAVFPASLEDCKCAIRFLRAKAKEYHLNPDRIGIWGPSAGGHLAALIGTTSDLREFEGQGGWPDFSSRVQAVVDWFGLSGYLKNVPAADPVNYVTSDDPPFLIMHGDKDPLVPLRYSERLTATLKKAGVEVTFHIVQGAGHGGPAFNTREHQELVDGFWDRHLKK
jgi:acetyl esterase/lipase